MRSLRGHSAAFTLIEVILVVVIIGLMAALAAPSFINAIHGQRLDSAAHQLAVACQQARYEALFGGNTCWYIVDFDNQTVRLLQEPRADTNSVITYAEIAAETNILESATAEVKHTAEIPQGVTITGVQMQNGDEQSTGVVGFPFYTTGVCEPFRVFIESDDGEMRAMDVDMFTGKTRVFTPLQDERNANDERHSR